MDISIENKEVVLKWNIPPKTHFYGTSTVIVELTTPALCTIVQVPVLSGSVRTEADVGNDWTILEVSLQFKGYTGKRLTNLLRGRIKRCDQGRNGKCVLQTKPNFFSKPTMNGLVGQTFQHPFTFFDPKLF